MLSAYGLSLADVVAEQQEPCALALSQSTHAAISQRFEKLSAVAEQQLLQQGFKPDAIRCEKYLNLRFRYVRIWAATPGNMCGWSKLLLQLTNKELYSCGATSAPARAGAPSI